MGVASYGVGVASYGVGVYGMGVASYGVGVASCGMGVASCRVGVTWLVDGLWLVQIGETCPWGVYLCRSLIDGLLKSIHTDGSTSTTTEMIMKVREGGRDGMDEMGWDGMDGWVGG